MSSPESAVTVSPMAVSVGPLGSTPVTFTVRPRLLAPGIYYNSVVVIDSRFGYGRTHYEKTMAFEITGTLNSVEVGPPIPTVFALRQNYPNPFNPGTTVAFDLPKAERVRLTVYDLLGREVSVLLDESRNAGTHEVWFDGSRLGSGAYFYRLQAGGFVQTKRLMLLK